MLLATFCAALFAGAALYINLVEHPARMRLDTAAALAQWVESYRRATWTQAPLALASLLSGAGAWALGGSTGWLLAALLIGAVVPFTLVVIVPVNHRLQGRESSARPGEVPELLRRWNSLHAVRTGLSLGALLWYLWLLAA